MILRKAVIISILSVIVVMLSVGTKVVNAPTVKETQAISYDDMVIWGYMIMGLLMVIIAFWTYKLHIVAGIIPFGLGVSALGYGIYVAYCKWWMII